MMQSPQSSIKLVLSDMDGTILSPNRTLSPSTKKSAQMLCQVGVSLALVSARPPEGMLSYVQQLALRGPCAGFNGGIIFTPEGTVQESMTFSSHIVEELLKLLRPYDMDIWFQNEHQWSVRSLHTDLVEKERRVIGVTPCAVADLATVTHDVNRLIVIGHDVELAAYLERELGEKFSGKASVLRSTSTKINITPAQATKGQVLHKLASLYGVEAAQVACLGDAQNDLPMLREAGLSIAMGQAPEDVKRYAACVTKTNAEDGWAEAIKEFIMPRVMGRKL